MNLKQKIEDWEKVKDLIQNSPYKQKGHRLSPETFYQMVEAIKEAAEVIDGLMGHPETECPCPVLAKRWRKKWGFSND